MSDLHSHGDKPTTALEESHDRVHAALDHAVMDYKKLGLFDFRRKAYMRGVMMALGMILQMFHELDKKYDNSNGEFN